MQGENLAKIRVFVVLPLTSTKFRSHTETTGKRTKLLVYFLLIVLLPDYTVSDSWSVYLVTVRIK